MSNPRTRNTAWHLAYSYVDEGQSYSSQDSSISPENKPVRVMSHYTTESPSPTNSCQTNDLCPLLDFELDVINRWREIPNLRQLPRAPTPHSHLQYACHVTCPVACPASFCHLHRLGTCCLPNRVAPPYAGLKAVTLPWNENLVTILGQKSVGRGQERGRRKIRAQYHCWHKERCLI